MEDNVGMLVMNMLQEFTSDYLAGWLDIDVYCNKKLLSAKQYCLALFYLELY